MTIKLQRRASIMGWLTDENHLENQIEIQKEMLEKKQEQYEQLNGIEGNANIEMQKQDLQEQIQQIQLNIEQSMEDAERAGREGQNYEQEQDLFDD